MRFTGGLVKPPPRRLQEEAPKADHGQSLGWPEWNEVSGVRGIWASLL